VKTWILCLTLGAVPALGGERTTDAPLALYTEFQQTPPDSVLDAIQDELDAILSPAGLQFSWYSLAEAGSRVSTQLAIIHFKGECTAEDLRPEVAYPGPLGWTHISNGEIIPFIDVNCEGIRLLVQRELLGMPARVRETVFGKAVARVLAHELYHLLANTTAHAGSGIAKAYYTAEELVGPSLQFSKKECEKLRGRSFHRVQTVIAGP
jgi:hypothetical protein